MDFDILEKDIEQLNKINTKANYTSRDRYNGLYKSIYERLLEMEKVGSIVLEPGKKSLSYLRELLINDGPEYSYSIVFFDKTHILTMDFLGVIIAGVSLY